MGKTARDRQHGGREEQDEDNRYPPHLHHLLSSRKPARPARPATTSVSAFLVDLEEGRLIAGTEGGD
jgi:hypothetical protein